MAKPTTNPPAARRLVRLDLDPAAHAALRLAAAAAQVPMSEFARRAVADAVRRAEAKKAK